MAAGNVRLVYRMHALREDFLNNLNFITHTVIYLLLRERLIMAGNIW